jgi:aspartyl-tRNA(Asn)/glutamyl-tRNA(Gln) amidotransferase subunit A
MEAAAPDVCELSAHELIAAYRGRSLSPVEVIDVTLDRIAATQPVLGAFATLCAERAREEAIACERAYLREQRVGALAGVPVGVKDVFDSAQLRTAYGSAMFATNVPATDAAAVRRVRAAGAILLGKTQTHEFAWGITSVNEAMGTSRNPWRPQRVPGGSSGGSAVALAARLVPLAIGSDTGGSIRIPSAFCGVVGFKPTYGRVSTEGLWPLAPSLDHAGPMARTPEDAALLVAAMGEAAPPAGDTAAPASPGLAGRAIGVCPDFNNVPLAPDVESAFHAAVGTVRELGARVVELRLPGTETMFPAFRLIQQAEALATHANAGLYPERAPEYGADVRGRLEAAERVTLADYLGATLSRERLRAATAALFERADLLLTPVAAGSPLSIGDEHVVHAGREIEFRELVMTYTVLQNLAGLPACTVRAGFDDLGIPIGIQFTGRPWSDVDVLSAAGAFFSATPAIQARWPEVMPRREEPARNVT